MQRKGLTDLWRPRGPSLRRLPEPDVRLPKIVTFRWGDAAARAVIGPLTKTRAVIGSLTKTRAVIGPLTKTRHRTIKLQDWVDSRPVNAVNNTISALNLINTNSINPLLGCFQNSLFPPKWYKNNSISADQEVMA